eukprot:3194864-Ditylum_brightwellii.AAC.1
MSPYIVDIHPSIYTAPKGIWTIEMTQKNLHKAIKDMELAVQVLPEAVPDEYFEKFDAFPLPRVIPLYGNVYKYTTQITTNVPILNNDNKEYALPPKNAWSRCPPTKILNETTTNNPNKGESNGKKKVSNGQYSALKESLEQAHKQNSEMLTQINTKLENKAKDTKLAIRSLVEEIIQEDLNEIIPEIVQGILEKIKAGTAISIKEMKS